MALSVSPEERILVDSTKDKDVLSSLPKETKSEKEIKEEKDGKDLASIQDCLLLADSSDYMWLTIGILGAAINGVGDPLMMVLFGEGMENLSGTGDMLKAMSRVSIYMTILGCILHVAGTVQYAGMTIFAQRQSERFKRQWFQAVMRQDMTWYDINDPLEIPGRIASSIPIFEKGVGLKVAEAIQFSITFIFAICLGFYYNAYISLLVTAMSPLVVYTSIKLIEVNSKASEAKTDSYAKANGIAYEVISSIKTILSFNGTNIFKEKYEQAIRFAEESGIQRSFDVGWITGALMNSFIAMYAGITLFGGWMLWMQVKENNCDPSGAADPRNECNYFQNLPGEQNGAGIIIALLCISFGGQAFGQISTALEAITAGRKAIKAAVDVIKRVPVIDINSDKGLVPSSLTGSITFQNVDFRYPARPDTQVLNRLNLRIDAGKTYAFVGESGCGKSTIMQLVQRFYDADEGAIFIDHDNIKDLNLKWLRKQMAIVSQEPKLFSGSIKENILHGLSAFGIEATEEEIINAAKMANAHDFIMKFPKGYDTEVGHSGSQLSGGQKQRVAIARALISRPKLLLLDEATSALDNTSEKIVQQALDRLITEGNGRTTLVIAHRLSTIRNADQICFVEKGVVVEQGTHKELMDKNGKYYQLVITQEGSQSSVSPPLSPTSNSNSILESSTLVEKSKNPVIENASLSPTTSDQQHEDSVVEEKKNEKEEDVPAYKVEFQRLWELNKPDFKYLLIGAIGAFVCGPTYPAWGWMFGVMMDIFYTPVVACSNDNPIYNPANLGYANCEEYFNFQSDQIRKRSFQVFWAWVILIILIQGSNIATFYGFGAASERLARRIRGMMFSHYLRQEPGYFDLPENAVGEICTRLEKDATYIKSKTGEPIQNFIVFVFGVLAGVILSLVYCWPIGLMAILLLPVLGTAFEIQNNLYMGIEVEDKDDKKGSGAIIGEAIGAMKTITSLSLQSVISEKFDLFVDEHEKKKNLVSENLYKGNGFGLSFAVMHWAYALLMWWGAWSMQKWDFTFQDWAISLFAFMFGLSGMSAAAQGATDARQVKKAIRNVFELLDRDTKIDPCSEIGSQLSLNGEINLEHVDFTYPSRPDLSVCNDYNLVIKAGTSIGLVGSSGSGKSTAISLIERFYDPDAGSVKIDDSNLKEINYKSFHRQIGYVGQEPTLFAGSIAENIAMGANDPEFESSITSGKSNFTISSVLMERVIFAAKQANAHDFIEAQPDGYNTDVGTAGNSKLSGGQKQRIAIARALISKPKILLFDEATSALDSESEHIVQDAINALIKGGNITCVMIAHRLTTVQALDMIAVVDKGHIIESGTHEQLMEKQGAYYALVAATSQN